MDNPPLDTAADLGAGNSAAAIEAYMSGSKDDRRVRFQHRRRFLRNAALGMGAGILCRFPSFALAAPRSTINLLVNEPGDTIPPEIYGHFLEDFGTVIYDGVWVGENSKIPNVGGVRKALIEGLRAVRSPVIRWPGGSFADAYDWKDGIGPRQSRPRRTNPYLDDSEVGVTPGPQDYESNQFGTPEFMQLCKLAGSQPYLTANVRSLPAVDFRRWVEYCNSPRGSTALAEMRRSDGSPEPFNVLYWGIGNEQWTYLSADEYAKEFRRFTQSVSAQRLNLKFIASGPIADGILPEGERKAQVQQWMTGLLKQPISDLNFPYGISLHYYTFNLSGHAQGTAKDYTKVQRSDTRFDASEWYEQLRQSNKVEGMIESYWAAAARYDPGHRVKLVVDEWGAFYKPESKLNPANLQGHAVTLRDALSSALALDIFNRHCDKVAMANLSFMINALSSLFFAQEEKFLTTPIFHVFQMYAAHQGGRRIRCTFDAPSISYEVAGQKSSIWGLNGSASVRGRDLTLTVVNPHISEAHEASIAIRGGSIKAGLVTTLTHRDIHAQNTFMTPSEVQPVTAQLNTDPSGVRHVFSPRSVTKIHFTLA